MLSPLVCKQSHVPADTHLQTCVCVCVCVCACVCVCVCSMIVLIYPSGCHSNKRFTIRDKSLRYTQKRFSVWRPADILDLQNFHILWRGCYWNQNLHLHTKFRWNRMTLGWDIARKKHFKNGGRLPSRILEIWYFGQVTFVRTWLCFFSPNFALVGR